MIQHNKYVAISGPVYRSLLYLESYLNDKKNMNYISKKLYHYICIQKVISNVIPFMEYCTKTEEKLHLYP